ncbi:FecR family protein [Sandaracinus amylolyticus]|uniref:FecR protein n=1 Tax=Sandaracinus amylolyticus TaxID=927083 RepID=A0A0F6W7H7_9BACT|nr:FecR family protein [Sandaracinus amylolyticus]AKF09398.1 FecR protein [Sandaracinus amylolyticus]
MSLPERIGDVLERADDEPRVRAAWEGTRARVAAREGRPRRAPIVAAGIAVAAAAVLALVVVPRAATPVAEERPDAPGPLRLDDGALPIATEAIASPRALVLSDRSRIELAPGARVVPRANDGAQLGLALERGRARFEVTPGGPRAWTIDCGPVQVRVVGTAFVIDRSDARIRVDVERGRVRVEGDVVPDGARVLDAGASIEVALARPIEPTPPPIATEPEIVAAPPRVRAPIARAPSRAWRAMAERGAHRDAYDALAAEGGVAATASRAAPDDLMLLADVARLSGHPEDAVPPLERLIGAHPDAAEAPLAAITLARIELSLERPARGARAYERAIELGVPRVFDAEVRAGLALARARAGDVEGAASAARECLARHPSPPHADALRALAERGPR